MATISVSNVTDGTTATAAGVNNQINTIVNEFNGNIDNANIKSAAAIDGSKLADASVTYSKVAAGFPVQFAYNQVSTAAIGTTTTPTDGTIPQNTEGDQFLTQAITPKSATNLLLVEVNAMVSYSVASKDLVIALFQDSTANALAANMVFSPAVATTPIMMHLRYVMVAGTTNSTTFKVRIGAETGAGGTLSLNAAIGVSPIFGSVIPKSNMTITEIKV